MVVTRVNDDTFVGHFGHMRVLLRYSGEYRHMGANGHFGMVSRINYEIWV